MGDAVVTGILLAEHDKIKRTKKEYIKFFNAKCLKTKVGY